MKLLLDTHVLLWALAEPEKLSAQATRALESTQNELWVSSVSLFEIATKVRLGKLAEPGPLLKQTDITLSRLGASLLPLSGPAAVLAGQLPGEHRDPFDRLLTAEAIVGSYTLVSADRALVAFSGLPILW